MTNIAVITAKGGNTTLANKNVIPIHGVPVMAYPIRAAKLSTKIDHVYVSTDDPTIIKIAESEGCNIIHRPSELCQSTSMHKDVIEHAVKELSGLYLDLNNVVVLLGNTVMVNSGIIDKCLLYIDSGKYDSCLTAWKAQDDHPYRALHINDDGFVESFLDASVNSNRQSYPTIYFYDQGVWAFNWRCAIEKQGPKPWVWMGKKCKLIERPWVTGRDIHSWIDVAACSWYLTALQAVDHMDYVYEV